MKGIPQNKKLEILKTLDKLGVNEESVYPGPEGTAKTSIGYIEMTYNYAF